MKYLLLCVPLLSGCFFSALTKECQDGFVDEKEACDDGNEIDGDGCDNNCTLTACGNGIIAGSEECDDSNQEIGDGCDAECLLENRFTLADINGANANNARFAVYTETITPTDGNGDGVPDADVARIDLYVTDQANTEAFCQVVADPNAFNVLPDAEGFQLLLIKEDAVGSGGFGSGVNLVSNGNVGAALLFAAPGRTFVGATVTKRAGGVNELLANGSVFEENDGSASIEITPDGKLTGQLNVTLTADRSGLVPFDTVEDFIDVDGEPDFFGISAPLEIEFRNVSKCQ
jgi:cysteine-rich repeat protein